MSWSEKEYNDYAKKMGIPLANAKLKEPLNTAKHQEALHTEEVETQPLSNILSFVVKGEPVAKGRPRVSKFGTYTPEKTVNYENLVQFSYLEKYKDKELLEGPLRMEVYLFFSIPKSYTNKKVKEIKSKNMAHDKKPDASNCLKSIEDALNAIAYKDDNQIVELYIEKKYTLENPRAEVIIKRLFC